MSPFYHIDHILTGSAGEHPCHGQVVFVHEGMVTDINLQYITSAFVQAYVAHCDFVDLAPLTIVATDTIRIVYGRVSLLC